MSHIVYDNSTIRVYDGLVRLCDYAGREIRWCDELWQEMLDDRELYDEFVYYLTHHVLADMMKVEGYSLTDLYVWQMERFNMRRDTGKNTDACNKEEMVLQAFRTMAEMKKDPETYLRKMNEGTGMDKI